MHQCSCRSRRLAIRFAIQATAMYPVLSEHYDYIGLLRFIVAVKDRPTTKKLGKHLLRKWIIEERHNGETKEQLQALVRRAAKDNAPRGTST